MRERIPFLFFFFYLFFLFLGGILVPLSVLPSEHQWCRAKLGLICRAEASKLIECQGFVLGGGGGKVCGVEGEKMEKKVCGVGGKRWKRGLWSWGKMPLALYRTKPQLVVPEPGRLVSSGPWKKWIFYWIEHGWPGRGDSVPSVWGLDLDNGVWLLFLPWKDLIFQTLQASSRIFR